MKKITKKLTVVLLLAGLLVLALSVVAFADDPPARTEAQGEHTFIENPVNTPSGDGYTNDIPTESDGGESLSGASYWAYADANTNPVTINGITEYSSYEGSYNPFFNVADADVDESNASNLYNYNGLAANDTFDGQLRRSRDYGPHGGYGSTSNKCATCHGVHRAEGAYVLLRADDPDHACDYCHVGDHRHSTVSAYWRASGNLRAANGHTIGAGPVIPDSSVWQWKEELTLESMSLNEPATTVVEVRRYEPERLEMFKWGPGHGGERSGPTYLRCQTCHQPHAAANMLWKPYKGLSGTTWSNWIDATTAKWDNGYKLLRNNPSGNIRVEAGDINQAEEGRLIVGGNGSASKARADNEEISGANAAFAVDSKYDGLTDASVQEPNQTITDGIYTDTNGEDDGVQGTIGDTNQTGYTGWEYPNVRNSAGTVWFDTDKDEVVDAGETVAMPGNGNVPRVEEVSMSFWCANCHNLDIASKAEGDPLFSDGESVLPDRAHQNPYRAWYGIAQETDFYGSSFNAILYRSLGDQCYACHNGDMPRNKGGNGTYRNLNGSGATVTINESACGQSCHLTGNVYRAYKEPATYATFEGVAGGNSAADWPHAGTDDGYKLLTDVDALYGQDANGDGYIDPGERQPVPAYVPTNPSANPENAGTVPTADDSAFRPYKDVDPDGKDKICRYCHATYQGYNN